MPGIDPYSGSPTLPPSWWKPASIIVGGGLLVFVIWTLPNWDMFWSHVSQFPSLWQLPTNRRIIIYLTIKIVSPLLIMAIIGIVVWINFLIQSSQREEGLATIHPEKAHSYSDTVAATKRDRNTSPSLREQQPTAYVASFSPLSRTQPVSASLRENPETPLPSTLSLQEAFKRHVEEAQKAKDEQPVLGTRPIHGNNTAAGDTIATPSFQFVRFSQPVPATQGSTLNAGTPPLISLRLLKDVSMTITIPDGGHVVVPLTLNAKRVQLLAYIAWRRGELIDRDKILEHVFGWGLTDEEATEDKLSERFESHKKLLRKKIRDVVAEQVNKPAQREIIDPDLDPFVSTGGFWGLAPICRVDDIEAIETNYKIITLARKEGRLIDEIPDDVQQACERIIASYPGDFLESLITKFPGDFRAWEGRSSWIRKPLTHYRDCYLDALWHAAEYEWRLGQGSVETRNGEREEANRGTQHEYFSRAAQRYQSYALYACNSRFDTKVTFGAHSEPGERIGMSERALRRCVVLLGATGRTDLVDQVSSAYYKQMKTISDQRWQPSKETQADVQAARAQTGAYRFAAQISQLSSEFAEQRDRVSSSKTV